MPTLFSSRRTRIAGTTLYIALAAVLVSKVVHSEWKLYIDSIDLPAEAKAVRNAFDVTEMVVDGQVLSPASDDAVRWSRVSVRERSVRIYRMNGEYEVYRAATDITGATTLDLRLTTDAKGTRRALLELRREGDGFLLEGQFEGRRVRARLAKIETSNSILLTRGFRWITEVPYNR